MATDFDRIDTIYKGQILAQEGSKQSDAFGIMDLYRYLNDPDLHLSPSQMQALFRSPKLRASFSALRAKLSKQHIPMLAAASDDDVDTRHFSGGHLKIVPASDGVHVYLVATFSGPQPTNAITLFLIDETETVHKRSFPQPDASGRTRLILDTNKTTDANFLRAFSAPRTTGDFVSNTNKPNGSD